MATCTWSLRNIATGNIIHITKTSFKVGRLKTADLHSENIVLSRNHATLIVIDNKLHILDHKSCNGTFINDRKWEELTKLNHGDIVGFGCSQKLIAESNTNIVPFIFEVIKNGPELEPIAPVAEPAPQAPVAQPVPQAPVAEPVPQAPVAEPAPQAPVAEPAPQAPVAEPAPQASVAEPAPQAPVAEPAPQAQNNSFSERVVECIVISDDENDDLSCSQIFEISAKIKQEHRPLMEVSDPYFEIKQELQDLDYCEKIIPVDLTDEDEIRTDKDLLKILESEPNFDVDHEHFSDVRENQIEPNFENYQEEFHDAQCKPTFDTRQNQIRLSFDDEQNVKQKQMKSLEDAVEDTNALKKNKVIYKNLSVQLKDIQKSSKFIQAKKKFEENKHTNKKYSNKDQNAEETCKDKNKISSKYTKPPIIAPHMEKQKLRRESSEKRIVVKERKRKSTDESKVIKKLKTSENTNMQITSTEIGKQYKDDKNRNKEERKRKLKELSEKFKQPLVPTKTNKKVAKVKVSDSRGNFLLNKISIVPNSSKNSTSINSKQEKSKKNPRIQKKSNSLDIASSSHVSTNGIKENKSVILSTSHVKNNYQIQDETISSNGSPQSYTNDHCVVPRLEVNITKPDSTVSDRLGHGLGITISDILVPQPSIISRQRMVLDNVDDEISRIVKWSIYWLHEQQNLEISPSVYGHLPPKQVPLTFSNNSQYYNFMAPLIMLELWQYVYQAFLNRDEERQAIYVALTHSRNFGSTTYLDCECHVSENNFKNNIFRTEDIALVELMLKDKGTFYKFTSFGFIKFSQRLNEHTGSGRHLKFTIVIKSIPYEIHRKNILIQVITNIGSFIRCFKTIKFLTVSPLCQRILNPDITDYLVPTLNNYTNTRMNLNREQMQIAIEAADMCLKDKPGIYLIKGPPGTGKSTVIIHIVLEILFRGQQNKETLILLTAPSNTAVDNLTLKISKCREKLEPAFRKLIRLVRIGPESSISKTVDKYTLSSLTTNNIISTEKLHCRNDFIEHLKSGKSRDAFLRNYFKENYNFVMKTNEDKLLLRSNVICTTLNSCVSYKLLHHARKNNLKVTCAIIDESTQCNELESLIPLQLGVDKFVLVGDPQQLPAVTINKEAQRLGFGRSLFSRLAENFKNERRVVRMLYEQYRMRPEICEYPNKTFYEGKLRSHPIHSNRIEPPIKPYILFNITRINEEVSVYVNYDEVNLIYNLLETLRSEVRKSCNYSIGIITPYRAQKELLSQKLNSIKFEQGVTLAINTVDSFQGMENDIIIISCVRYCSNNFLQNEQRLNVALTRAKQGLYIVGNYNLFKDCKTLYDLREDAKTRRLCLDISGDPKNYPSFQKYIF